jgi:hypothetical protein
MNIEEVFSQIITDLQANKRPLIKLTEQDLDTLASAWHDIIESKNWKGLFKILCILDNTVTLSPKFFDQINTTLRECDDEEIMVLTLGAARKHIIDENHKRGERVKMEFIKTLKALLSHGSPEVLEWTLRLIEGLGSQSIILKEDVLAAKPGFMAIFNEHKKATKQIIELLEKKWTRK